MFEAKFLDRRVGRARVEGLEILSVDLPGFRASVSDISAQGAKIVLQASVPVGRWLLLTFRSQKEEFSLMGEVRWCGSGEGGTPVAGIAFLTGVLDQESRGRWESFVEGCCGGESSPEH